MSHSRKIITAAVVLAVGLLAAPDNGRSLQAADPAGKFSISAVAWFKNGDRYERVLDRLRESGVAVDDAAGRQEVLLTFRRESVVVALADNFKLHLNSYAGADGRTLTVEYTLHKDGHPLDDPVIGIARGHVGLEDARGEQFSRLHFYVNLDATSKLEINVERVPKGG